MVSFAGNMVLSDSQRFYLLYSGIVLILKLIPAAPLPVLSPTYLKNPEYSIEGLCKCSLEALASRRSSDVCSSEERPLVGT